MGEQIILAVQSIANAFWDGFFVFFTVFGEELVFVLLVAVLYWCVSKEFAFKLVLTYLLSALVNFSLKEIVREPRPQNVRKLFGDSATGYAFPSGHTQSAALYASAMTAKFAAKKVWAHAAAVGLVLAVGLSRMYLGHHYLQDVLAGGMLGYLIGFFGTKLFARVRISNLWYLLLILPAGLLLVFVDSHSLYKAVGGGISLVIGYVLEERLIKSGEPKRAPAVIIRLALGLGVAAGLYFGLGAIAPGSLLMDFTAFFLIGLWVSFLAPALFLIIERHLPKGKGRAVLPQNNKESGENNGNV